MIKAHILYAAAIAALAGALWYAIERNISTSETVAEQRQNLEAMAGQLDTAQNAIDDQRQDNERLQQRIRTLSQARDRIEQSLQAARRDREALEATDEEHRAWATTRLPGATRRLLQRAPLHPGADTRALPEPGGDSAAGGAPEPGTYNDE